MKLADPAAQALDPRLDFHNVASIDGSSESHSLDPSEERYPPSVLRFGQNQDGPDLGDALCQDRRRERRPLPRLMREIALVHRNVLDANDPFVRFELGDAIDEQKRVPMGQYIPDDRVIQRQAEVHAAPV